MPMRPGRCYSHITSQPYTRKEYIHGAPQPKITKFEIGNKELLRNYEVKLELISLERGQIRSNALESARVMTSKYLSTTVGDSNYYMRMPKYPHQVIRENKMMAFAGADRLQDGMRLSFGTPVGVAAIIDNGDRLIEIWGKKSNIEALKEALRRGASKLPLKTRIIILESKQ
ncbi:MAG: 50S ribosomal protein L16 [Caldisphaera sp.]|jgi:large subunit ribosomal protein L10e|nr:50S ribosomal protein L16 [Caldisphaera sp.]PMP61171.1 MAG: 50S ribosomal protein L16 [Caldisphaera sp.]PMP90842.1 MAG: 50S ribosomal protein L16 [Caldisphaera sp.]